MEKLLSSIFSLLSVFLTFFLIKLIITLLRKISLKFGSRTDFALSVFHRGNYSKALKIFKSIRKSHNLTMTNYFTFLGLCYQNLGNQQEAIKNYNAAIDSDRLNIIAQLNKIDILYLDDIYAYEAELVNLLRLFPNNYRILFRQGKIYYNKGELVLAESCFNNVHQIDSDNHQVQDYLFKIYNRIDQDKAKNLIDQMSLSKNPNYHYYKSLVVVQEKESI